MNAFIFVFGLLVTVVACGAVGGIWWAALRDGQTHDAIMRGEQTGLDEAAPLRPRAASEQRIPGLEWQAAVRSASVEGAAGQATAVRSPDKPAT
jgi:hypothetical protein